MKHPVIKEKYFFVHKLFYTYYIEIFLIKFFSIIPCGTVEDFEVSFIIVAIASAPTSSITSSSSIVLSRSSLSGLASKQRSKSIIKENIFSK